MRKANEGETRAQRIDRKKYVQETYRNSATIKIFQNICFSRKWCEYVITAHHCQYNISWKKGQPLHVCFSFSRYMIFGTVDHLCKLSINSWATEYWKHSVIKAIKTCCFSCYKLQHMKQIGHQATTTSYNFILYEVLSVCSVIYHERPKLSM